MLQADDEDIARAIAMSLEDPQPGTSRQLIAAGVMLYRSDFWSH